MSRASLICPVCSGVINTSGLYTNGYCYPCYRMKKRIEEKPDASAAILFEVLGVEKVKELIAAKAGKETR